MFCQSFPTSRLYIFLHDGIFHHILKFVYQVDLGQVEKVVHLLQAVEVSEALVEEMEKILEMNVLHIFSHGDDIVVRFQLRRELGF